MRYATFSILIFLFLLGCKEKDPSPSPETYCSDNPGACETVMEGKKYFAFGMGSWWVYEEENSGNRDSVYVTDASNDMDGYDFNIRMHSTYQNYNYHYWPQYIDVANCNLYVESLNRCMLVYRAKGKPGEDLGQSYCFVVNLRKGDSLGVSGNIYDYNNKIVISEIYPTYTLGTLNFQKTIKLYERNTRAEGIQPTNHYYSKGVGIIRKEFLDSNQVWNLVDYHIEP